MDLFAGRIALSVSILMLPTLVGCANTPTISSVLKENYAGYSQVLPWAEVNLTDTQFPYIPGTIASFTEQHPETLDEAAIFSFSGEYCSPGYPMKRLRARPLPDSSVYYSFDTSLRRTFIRAKKRAEEDLTLNEDDIRLLRRVVIRITRARAYSLARPTFSAGSSKTGCSLQYTASLAKITSVIAGDVRVDVAFKTNIGLDTRVAITNKIHAALGFGYFNVEVYNVVATNVVFGAKLLRVIKRSPST